MKFLKLSLMIIASLIVFSCSPTKPKYKIYVGYYGDRQFTEDGPSTIMAEIFTKYADKTEQRKVVTLQMSKAEKKYGGDKVEVAEFEF